MALIIAIIILIILIFIIYINKTIPIGIGLSKLLIKKKNNEDYYLRRQNAITRVNRLNRKPPPPLNTLNEPPIEPLIEPLIEPANNVLAPPNEEILEPPQELTADYWLHEGDRLAFHSPPANYRAARWAYARVLLSKDARQVNDAKERLANLDIQQFGNWQTTLALITPPPIVPTTTAQIQQLIAPNNVPTFIRPRVIPYRPLEKPIERVIQATTPVINDTQNVHDPLVVKSVNNIINILRPIGLTEKSPIMMLNDIAGANTNKITKQKALRVFDELKPRDMITAYNISTLEAAMLVWNHAPIETIVDQLASCIENGIPICQMGKVNRIIQSVENMTINGIMIPFIKNKALLRREIMETAAHFRNEYDKKGHPEEGFKTALINNLYTTYTSSPSPLMSRDILDAEVNQWIDHI